MRRRLPWLLWGASVGLSLATVVFMLLAGGRAAGTEGNPAFDLVLALGLLTFPTVGLVIASRRPENAIGWLFCAVGVPFALSSACFAYATYTLGAGGPLPGGEFAAWLNVWLFLPSLFGLPALLFLLFPDGRLLGPRWRPVVWLTVAAMIGVAAAPALRPGVMPDAAVEGTVNPLGIEGADAAIDTLEAVAGTSALLSIALAAASLVIRFRRSRGVERLQLKWFVSAALVFALACLAFLALAGELEFLGQLLILTSYALIPVAAGVAILRHRLYDIDVVINRALVYGLLTATLGGAYLGCVLLVGLAVGRSGFAVAVSTLAVAALFRPARARIQGAVDRRFYRRRYDATRTLEAFGGRLRDEIDLEALAADLRGVVSETVQPSHVSLWLRSPR
jgi:hypothetical protein